MVAASDPAVRGIVTLSGPSRNFLAIAPLQARHNVETDPTIPIELRDSAIAAMLEQWFTIAASRPGMLWLLDDDPLPTARQIRQPALIIGAAHDWQVPPEQARELVAAMRAAGNKQAEVWIAADGAPGSAHHGKRGNRHQRVPCDGYWVWQPLERRNRCHAAGKQQPWNHEQRWYKQYKAPWRSPGGVDSQGLARPGSTVV
jgi:pimeloyl-ACP methyl ester carboxylesterase